MGTFREVCFEFSDIKCSVHSEKGLNCEKTMTTAKYCEQSFIYIQCEYLTFWMRKLMNDEWHGTHTHRWQYNCVPFAFNELIFLPSTKKNILHQNGIGTLNYNIPWPSIFSSFYFLKAIIKRSIEVKHVLRFSTCPLIIASILSTCDVVYSILVQFLIFCCSATVHVVVNESEKYCRIAGKLVTICHKKSCTVVQ